MLCLLLSETASDRAVSFPGALLLAGVRAADFPAALSLRKSTSVKRRGFSFLSPSSPAEARETPIPLLFSSTAAAA